VSGQEAMQIVATALIKGQRWGIHDAPFSSLL